MFYRNISKHILLPIYLHTGCPLFYEYESCLESTEFSLVYLLPTIYVHAKVVWKTPRLAIKTAAVFPAIFF